MNQAITLIMLLCVAAFAQQKGTLTDPRDGKKYKTVKIGTQTWMAENLNYASEGSRCYDGKPENCNKYGRLYFWKDALEVCPTGWHLASKKEWKELWEQGRTENNLKAKSGWNKYDFSEKNPNNPQCKLTVQVPVYDDYDRPMVDRNGRAKMRNYVHDYCNTDKFGFSALPSGRGRVNDKGINFNSAGNITCWWTFQNGAWNGSSYNINEGAEEMSFNNGKTGASCTLYSDDIYSVRCIQDN